MRLYSFEKLEVYARIRVYIKEIYLVSDTFPSDEKFGMVSQIRRAGVSISNNIAEGAGRISGKEQARFTEIAFASLLETLNLLNTASDLGFISLEKVNKLRPIIEEIGNKLNALRKAQLNRGK